MNNQSSDGFSKGLVFGAMIGGAVGAITALLLAPKSGAELRKDIAEKSSDIYDKTTDYLYNVESSIGTAVNSTVNEGKVRAQNIIDSARKQAEGLLSNAESVLQEARNKASLTKNNVQDKINDIRDAAKASAETFRNEMNSSDKNETLI